MLEDRRVEDKERLTPRQAHETLQKLIHRYPTHGYLISCGEAKKLGLPVRPLSKYKFADFASFLLDRTIDDESSLVDVMSEDEILEIVKGADMTPNAGDHHDGEANHEGAQQADGEGGSDGADGAGAKGAQPADGAQPAGGNVRADARRGEGAARRGS